MSRTSSPFRSLMLALSAGFCSSSAHACTVCMGDPESKFAEATNAAIFLMLALIGGVLTLLGAFAIYLHRRALAPLPPHVEIADSIDPHSGTANI